MVDENNPSPIHRLYLDTEPLRAAQWPSVSTALHGLLALADVVDVPIFLPEAADRERSTQFLREYRETAERYSSAARNVRDVTRAVGIDWQPPGTPSDAEVATAYEALAAGVKERYKVQPVLLANRSVMDYFVSLLERQPPFDEKGRGLGDAIIYESVAEHLSQSPDARGLLISGDGDFKGVVRLAGERGLLLEIASLPTAYQRLLGQLTLTLAKHYDAALTRLREYLYGAGDTLIGFIEANVTFPVTSLTFFTERVLGVGRITEFTIGTISTQPPLWSDEAKPGVELTLNVSTTVTLPVSVSVWPMTPPKTIKAGEQVQEEKLAATGPVIQERHVKNKVELRATVVVAEDGYQGLVLIEAQAEQPLFGTLGGLIGGTAGI